MNALLGEDSKTLLDRLLFLDREMSGLASYDQSFAAPTISGCAHCINGEGAPG